MAISTWQINVNNQNYEIEASLGGMIFWNLTVRIDKQQVIDEQSFTVFGIRGDYPIQLGSKDGKIVVGGLRTNVELYIDGKKQKKARKSLIQHIIK